MLFPPSLLHRLLRSFDKSVMDVCDDVPLDRIFVFGLIGLSWMLAMSCPLFPRIFCLFDRPVMDVGDDVPFDFTRSVSSLVGVQEGLRTHEQQAETLKKSQHMVPL